MATTQNFIVKSGLVVQGSTNATSTNTGALQVAGGAGIGGDLWVGGTIYMAGAGLDKINSTTGTFVNIYVTGTNVSSNTTTGALVVSGGVGVGGSLYATALYDNGARVLTTATLGGSGIVNSLTAGTDTVVNTSTGAVTIWNNSTLQTITSRGASSNVAISLTNTTDATSVGSGALIVSGGVGIAKSLYVGVNTILQGTTATTLNVTGAGQSITAVGATFTGQITNSNGTASTTTGTGALVLTNAGGLGVGGQVTAGKVVTTDATAATTGGAGSLQIAGGAYVANNLVVMGSAASTATTTSNALYVAGGLGVSGSAVVGGPTVFKDTVTFQGTTTYVYSTNTVYTDNIIELHMPNTGTQWTLDDGKDIGLRFHYYANSTDTNAALVLANDTKMFEFYGSGVESTASTIINGQYGGIKAGYMTLTSSTVASSTTTGALIVAGGVGIGGSLYAGNMFSNGSPVITSASLGSYGVSQITTSSGIGITPSSGTGTVQIYSIDTLQDVTSRGASTNVALSITNNTPATNTTTGALKVSGGIGAGQVYATNLFDSGNRVVTSVTPTAGTGIGITASNTTGPAATFTIANFGVTSLATGTVGISVSSNTGSVTISNLGVTSLATANGALGVSAATGAITLTNLGVTSLSTGTGISVSASTGSVTITNIGVTSLASSGSGLGVSAANGAVTLTNLGVTSLAGTANQVTVSANTGSVTISLPSGIQTTNGTFTNSLFVQGTQAAVSTTTGALQIVNGGIGVGSSIYVGTTATVAGTFNRSGNISAVGWLANGISMVSSTATYTDTSLTGAQGMIAFNAFGKPTIGASNTPTYSDAATVYIADAPTTTTNALITSPWALYVASGNVKVNNGNLTVSGTGNFSANGVTIGNTMMSSYTSGAISTSTVQNLDVFAVATYRTARYVWQIVDGTKVHVTEMTIFHDGTVVYKDEYGVSTNTGELGTFDATIGGGNITVTFTPNYTPTSMVIKASRTIITA